jgi:hypothetical protein
MGPLNEIIIDMMGVRHKLLLRLIPHLKTLGMFFKKVDFLEDIFGKHF